MIPRRKPRFYNGQLYDILRFIFSKNSTEGEYINLFEKKLAEYIGTKFAITVNSGRAGLGLLLDAYGLKEGDEIILPAYTLKDLAKLIEDKGIVPKFVDIEKDSFIMDCVHIESQISPKTKIILATHIFGLPCNLGKIIAIAKKYHLKVIEDCAHAIGAGYQGKKLGSWGDAAIFSLEFSKNINTFGGGVVTTSDEKIASFLKQRIETMSFSKSTLIKKILFCYLQYYLTIVPFVNLSFFLFCFKGSASFIKRIYFNLASKTRDNVCKYTNLQAFVGLKQLMRLDEMNAHRTNLALRLNSLLRNNFLVEFQTSCTERERVYYFYLIRLHRSYDLYKFRRQLFFKGIDCGIFSEITDNCALTFNGNYSNTNEVFRTAIQLPLFDNMSSSQLKKIAISIKTILRA